MSTKSNTGLFKQTYTESRRRFLRQSGAATFSGATIAMLSGFGSQSAFAGQSMAAVEQDIRVLNTAIGAEHEAVAAYQLGAESGLLTPGALKVAMQLFAR